jgi:hypothetical protein
MSKYSSLGLFIVPKSNSIPNNYSSERMTYLFRNKAGNATKRLAAIAGPLLVLVVGS